MRIIDARTGTLHAIPLTLGEEGRPRTGRHLERVDVSNRPGQTPSGPDDVGFHAFGDDSRRHVILTTPRPGQGGILLVCRTSGQYVRDGSGGTSLVAGEAYELTHGSWALGDAGRVGGGTDSLWHVPVEAIFVMTICRADARWVFCTRSGRVIMLRTQDVVQFLATDEDSELSELVRQYASSITDPQIQAALAVADRLEQDEVSQEPGAHMFDPSRGSLASQIQAFNIAIPPALAHLPLVGGVEAGTLIPGDRRLVAIVAGPGGGKRYSISKYEVMGLVKIGEDVQRSTIRLLAIVESDDWIVTVESTKDGGPHLCEVASKDGIVRTTPLGSSRLSWDGARHDMPAPERKLTEERADGLRHSPFAVLQGK